MEICIYNRKPICAYDVTNINGILNYAISTEWREAGRNGELRCPECEGEVRLNVKDPNKKAPHFAHKSKSDCSFSNNDIRESEEHKRGKMKLYHYFKEKYPDSNIDLNKRFSNNRRCDLYIEFSNGDKLAVEFQRTNISKGEWQERHDAYVDQNIHDLWILSSKKENFRLRDKQIELDYFEQVMLNELDKPVVYFDVDKLQITLVKNMKHVDSYIKNNDIEELYMKDYNLRDILITSKGVIECNFHEEYEKRLNEFNEYHTKKSLAQVQHIEQEIEDRERIIEQQKKFYENHLTITQNQKEEELDDYMNSLFEIKSYGRMSVKEFFDFVKSECKKELTKQQIEAIIYDEGHHSVQSTAGSGKTTVICCKIAYLILVKNINPNKIAVMSFSKASAADIEERFKLLFGQIIKESISFSTIHSFSNSIIRHYEKTYGIKYTIIENQKNINRDTQLKSIYKTLNKKAIAEDELKELNSFITFIRNSMIYYNDLDKYEESFPVPNFKKIYYQYSQNLNNNNWLDYDSILTMAHHILKNNDKIKNIYQNKYDWLLIDEAQDNSKLQNAIIKILVDKREDGKNANVCMVGDTDQSIYSWRGADFSEFNNFEERFPSSKVLFMDENFRSTAVIVNLANRFIRLNKDRYDKNIFTRNSDGDKIEVLESEDERTQLEYIMNCIKHGNRKYKDFAVLYRNNISAIPLIEKLMNEKIPFYIKDDVGTFFSNFIVKDILNFIRFSKEPYNLNVFKNIYYKCQIYLKKSEVAEIKANQKDVLQFLINSNKITGHVKTQCIIQKNNFATLAKITPKKVIDYIENNLKYREHLENYSREYNYSMDYIETILSTLKIICSNLENIEQLQEKLKEMKDAMTLSQENKDKDVLTLSTIHSSKGLEWEEVFIIDAQEIPSKFALKKFDEGITNLYQEEVRAFFVAITRPKLKLHIIQPNFKNGQVIDKSPFLEYVKQIINQKSQNNSIIYENDKKIIINETKNISDKIQPKYVKGKFKIGTTIRHKIHGIGEIININEIFVTMKKSNGKEYNISLNVCIKGILVQVIAY